MPARYAIDKERRLVVSTGWDRLTFADILAHREQFTTDPDFDPTFNQLADLTLVTEMAISVEEARTLAVGRIFSPTSRRAFVAPSPVVFGMFRLMEAYHELEEVPGHVSVFQDRDAALRWLGLDGMPPAGFGSTLARDLE